MFSGKVEFGPEVTKTDDNSVLKHNLFNDLIFDDIKDLAFSSVFVNLKEKGQKLKDVYNQSKNMNITAMKEFVANNLKSLQTQHKSLFLRKFLFFVQIFRLNVSKNLFKLY